MCRDIGAIAEHETWDTVTHRKETGSALILDATCPFDEKRGELERWVRQARQPMSILCVSAERGAAALESWAARMGYCYTLQGDALAEYRADLQRHLVEIIGEYTWLVPEITHALDCGSLWFVRALHAACLMIPDHTSVEHWATEGLGLKGRRSIEELFVGEKLPGPKVVLDWLRVSKVVAFAAAEGVVKPGKLAPVFGCRSGRYLGLRIRSLTDRSLEEVLNMSIQEVLRLLIRKYRRC